MGPFEIAPGTQWDYSPEFQHGMFPPRSFYGATKTLAQQKMPQMGDISVRSALTIHRGTANHSNLSRPVLVLGVDAPRCAQRRTTRLSNHARPISKRCPKSCAGHLTYRLVDELEPIEQGHTIEGLVMGEA
jgi:hypothetical protein